MDIKDWFEGKKPHKERSYGYNHNLYPIADISIEKRMIENDTMFEITIKMVGYAMNVNEAKDNNTRLPFDSGYRSFEIENGKECLEFHNTSQWDMGKALKRASKQAAALLKNIFMEKMNNQDNTNNWDKQLFLVLPQ